MMKRAKEQLDDCEDTDCKFNPSGQCCYGMRNKAGCYMEDAKAHESMMDSHCALVMAQAKFKYRDDLDEDEEKAIKEVDRIINKSFHFVFRGHEYTVSDSARDQSRCPHCGHQTDDGRCWSEEDSAYIGTYNDGADVELCFECPKCFEKFFFHGAV